MTKREKLEFALEVVFGNSFRRMCLPCGIGVYTRAYDKTYSMLLGKALIAVGVRPRARAYKTFALRKSDGSATSTAQRGKCSRVASADMWSELINEVVSLVGE